MVENSAVMGKVLEEEMRKIKSPLIADQRGKGLFRAIEFVKDAKIDGNDFAAELLRQGMITRVSHNYVVRMCPPLVIKEKEIKVAVNKMKKAVTYLENLSKERSGK
jgi:ornithine--oxo-acid transaminase